jgi:predicted ATPase
MSKIKIKNFGPIKEGYLENDGWLEVKKATMFIGNQGSGKSTVAKLISALSWIEKALVKGIIREDELNINNRFVKELAYQRIDKYLKDSTLIEYEGKAFSFLFTNGAFEAIKSASNGYLLPKIMYAPAERTFLSVVDRPDKLKNLPKTLYTFNDEFDAAKDLYADGLVLPINNISFEYDKLNKIAHIVDESRSYKIRLSEASSGFHSTVPLYLVTKYLSDRLTAEEDPSIQETSLEDQKKVDKLVKTIMNDSSLTTEIRQSLLRQLSASRKPACFINIVEEPEQNLFPSSQRSLLFELLSHTRAEGNKLIITTHSPYLVNYLSIAIQGAELYSKLVEAKALEIFKERLEKIIPVKSLVTATDVVIYQMDETDGSIKKLPDYEGVPSDKNYLNESLRAGNGMFDSLLEIEQEL